MHFYRVTMMWQMLLQALEIRQWTRQKNSLLSWSLYPRDGERSSQANKRGRSFQKQEILWTKSKHTRKMLRVTLGGAYSRWVVKRRVSEEWPLNWLMNDTGGNSLPWEDREQASQTRGIVSAKPQRQEQTRWVLWTEKQREGRMWPEGSK